MAHTFLLYIAFAAVWKFSSGHLHLVNLQNWSFCYVAFEITKVSEQILLKCHENFISQTALGNIPVHVKFDDL